MGPMRLNLGSIWTKSCGDLPKGLRLHLALSSSRRRDSVAAVVALRSHEPEQYEEHC